MEHATILGQDIYEGTWEEIQQLAPRFNGHTLRVQVVAEPVSWPISLVPVAQTLACLKAELAEMELEPNPAQEEIQKAEEELLELKRNLNENRRRDGAEILFTDV